MKIREDLPKMKEMTLDELSGCFQNGNTFKCGRKALRPSRGKVSYPCSACHNRMTANNIQQNDREWICKACIKADANIKFNLYHFIEVIY